MTTLLRKYAVRASVAVGLVLACGCGGNKSSQEAATPENGNGIAPANVTLTVKRGTSEGTPTMVATKVYTAQVRVEAIDYENRGIVLLGPQGDQEIFTVGPDVVNFDQIHKGDMVNAKFTQKLAISVQKGTGTDQAVLTGEIALPPLGDKPGIVATRTGEITATVTAIDHDSRVVSVTGPRGNTLTFQVAPQAEGLENVQVGDQVVAKYTEAVEITVTGS